ncbi:endo-1,3(4)-beta-glucanase [Saccharomycopsis crataegensis]|uniref:glucan endo-1,3-beta-D-glucosidase n=1 Tax=Saccharomycopsis crataegensis TaxID=43959 RepID=A0AAV5QS27_9ASCO|nr:endo-1,3(4)-beta-glucanase [Saccharomycopsis crataegensis]
MAYDRPEMPLPGAKKHHHLFGNLVSKFEQLKVDHLQPTYDQNNNNNNNNNNNSDYDDSIFSTPVATDNPIDYFGSTSHPLPIDHVVSQAAQSKPIETNKFYGNLMLEDQTCTIWTNPYSLSYSRNDQFGLAVYHTTDAQKVYGPGDPVEYYLNPIGIKSIVLSAKEFESKDDVKLTMDNLQQFSADLNFSYRGNPNESFTSPVVQGMGFITAIYENLTLDLNSVVGFKEFERVGLSNEFNSLTKYRITLFNDVVWSLYLSGAEANNNPIQKIDNNHITSADKFSKVTVQICCGFSDYYDKVAGTYVTSIDLRAKQNSATSANYCFQFNSTGSSLVNQPIMWAFPHHIDSFATTMENCSTDLILDSTICGKMKAYINDKFEFVENDLPSYINFEAWSSLPTFNAADVSNGQYYNSNALNKIAAALEVEVNDDVEGFSNLDSMYFSGKQLDKYAYILYVSHYILKDANKTQIIMTKLQKAFDRFIQNRQISPLVYDTKFKTLISQAGLHGDPNLDFGNSYCNDHHFHYGYHVHAAAILGQIDRELGGNWLVNNEKYINFLIRDFANPTDTDEFFAVNRSFDWFAGHSWAKGLFASADGKDQESSSEDYNAYYGLKLWGQVANNPTLTFRSTLQLAILKRVCDNYILMKDSNRNQPRNFIGNKVPGILFENKCHHATYFGANLEYIQGIHMIPLTAASSYFRSQEFVRQEWDQLLANHVEKVNDGWKGILMLNTVLMDPKMAWSFFSQQNFNRGWLDGGMSLTYSLALIAGMGGAV